MCVYICLLCVSLRAQRDHGMPADHIITFVFNDAVNNSLVRFLMRVYGSCVCVSFEWYSVCERRPLPPLTVTV